MQHQAVESYFFAIPHLLFLSRPHRPLYSASSPPSHLAAAAGRRWPPVPHPVEQTTTSQRCPPPPAQYPYDLPCYRAVLGAERPPSPYPSLSPGDGSSGGLPDQGMDARIQSRPRRPISPSRKALQGRGLNRIR